MSFLWGFSFSRRTTFFHFFSPTRHCDELHRWRRSADDGELGFGFGEGAAGGRTFQIVDLGLVYTYIYIWMNKCVSILLIYIYTRIYNYIYKYIYIYMIKLYIYTLYIHTIYIYMGFARKETNEPSPGEVTWENRHIAMPPSTKGVIHWGFVFVPDRENIDRDPYGFWLFLHLLTW